MKDKGFKGLEGFFGGFIEAQIAIEVCKRLLIDVRKEMDMDEEDFDCYINQIEMDNKGLGINGKIHVPAKENNTRIRGKK